MQEYYILKLSKARGFNAEHYSMGIKQINARKERFGKENVIRWLCKSDNYLKTLFLG